jgi:hypothetical protein
MCTTSNTPSLLRAVAIYTFATPQLGALIGQEKNLGIVLVAPSQKMSPTLF